MNSSSWQAVKYYGHWVKMCKDFAPNFGDKRTGFCIMTVHRLTLSFHQGVFDQKQRDCRPAATSLFSGSLIEGKTEWPPFWHKWGDQSRITSATELPHRSRLPGCI
jgi:hypothetical protein